MRIPKTGLRLTLLALVLALYAGAFLLTRASPPLLWNTSASLPLGLYLRVPGPARVGDVVAACLPPDVAALAVERGYVAPGHRCAGTHAAPVLKHLAARAGTRVAYRDQALRLDRRQVPASALRQLDRRGRPLPAGVLYPYTVPPGRVLLLNPHPDSFDGRYLGPLPESALLGVYRPLVTWGQ